LEPGSCELRTVGKVSRGYFHHGDKVRRKVVIEHVSWILLEPHRRGVYCQLQTNELLKEVLSVNKIKHLFSHFVV